MKKIHTLYSGEINGKHQRRRPTVQKWVCGSFCDHALYLKMRFLDLVREDLWVVENQESTGTETWIKSNRLWSGHFEAPERACVCVSSYWKHLAKSSKSTQASRRMEPTGAEGASATTFVPAVLGRSGWKFEIPLNWIQIRSGCINISNWLSLDVR